MPTAVTYARFSSDRQHESSIEAQHAAIHAYAQRKGIEIVGEYADRAISGTTDRRPEFLRLMADLSTRPVDYVLVHKYDRFSRSRYDAAIYSRLISQRGARLIAVAQDVGTAPEAIIMESMLQSWAEYYSLNLSSEVIKGRKVNLSKGRHPGGMYPFGYASDGNGGYRIVEDEAYYIRKLYDAVIAGTPPVLHIVSEMRSIGMTGRRGSYLTSGNVSTLLRNPIYAGVYLQRAGGQTTRIDNHHPAIVPMSIYEEACKVMDSRANAGRAPKREYLLTSMVRCACGKPMYGHVTHKAGHTYASYVCYGACGNRSIRMSELDEAACNYVHRLLAPKVREQLVASLTSYIDGQRRHARRTAPDRRREIARLRAEVDALTQNLASGVLPASVVASIGEQITQRESQIELLTALCNEPPQVDPHSVEAYFADVSSISADMPVAELRPILRRFIASITVHSTAIEFTSTFDAWLREHCPELISSLTLPPDDPTDPPRGSKRRSRRKVLPPNSSTSPASSPNHTASTPASTSSPRAHFTGSRTFSKLHTPANRSNSKNKRSR